MYLWAVRGTVNIIYKVNMGEIKSSHKKNLQKFLCNKNLNVFLSTLIKRIINDCLRTIGLHIPLFLGKG